MESHTRSSRDYLSPWRYGLSAREPTSTTARIAFNSVSRVTNWREAMLQRCASGSNKEEETDENIREERRRQEGSPGRFSDEEARCLSAYTWRNRPSSTSPLARTRPQSASTARSKPLHEQDEQRATRNLRPQSAKASRRRSTPQRSLGQDLRWMPREVKASKWTEMLQHGPSFEEPALKRLEDETYALLQHVLRRPKPTRTVAVNSEGGDQSKQADLRQVETRHGKMKLAAGSGLQVVRQGKQSPKKQKKRKSRVPPKSNATAHHTVPTQSSEARTRRRDTAHQPGMKYDVVKSRPAAYQLSCMAIDSVESREKVVEKKRAEAAARAKVMAEMGWLSDLGLRKSSRSIEVQVHHAQPVSPAKRRGKKPKLNRDTKHSDDRHGDDVAEGGRLAASIDHSFEDKVLAEPQPDGNTWSELRNAEDVAVLSQPRGLSRSLTSSPAQKSTNYDQFQCDDPGDDRTAPTDVQCTGSDLLLFIDSQDHETPSGSQAHHNQGTKASIQSPVSSQCEVEQSVTTAIEVVTVCDSEDLDPPDSSTSTEVETAALPLQAPNLGEPVLENLSLLAQAEANRMCHPDDTDNVSNGVSKGDDGCDYTEERFEDDQIDRNIEETVRERGHSPRAGGGRHDGTVLKADINASAAPSPLLIDRSDGNREIAASIIQNQWRHYYSKRSSAESITRSEQQFYRDESNDHVVTIVSESLLSADSTSEGGEIEHSPANVQDDTGCGDAAVRADLNLVNVDTPDNEDGTHDIEFKPRDVDVQLPEVHLASHYDGEWASIEAVPVCADRYDTTHAHLAVDTAEGNKIQSEEDHGQPCNETVRLDQSVDQTGEDLDPLLVVDVEPILVVDMPRSSHSADRDVDDLPPAEVPLADMERGHEIPVAAVDLYPAPSIQSADRQDCNAHEAAVDPTSEDPCDPDRGNPSVISRGPQNNVAHEAEDGYVDHASREGSMKEAALRIQTWWRTRRQGLSSSRQSVCVGESIPVVDIAFLDVVENSSVATDGEPTDVTGVVRGEDLHDLEDGCAKDTLDDKSSINHHEGSIHADGASSPRPVAELVEPEALMHEDYEESDIPVIPTHEDHVVGIDDEVAIKQSRAASRIQCQFLRFIYRRNLLEQLQFFVRQQRREARKKTRRLSASQASEFVVLVPPCDEVDPHQYVAKPEVLESSSSAETTASTALIPATEEEREPLNSQRVDHVEEMGVSSERVDCVTQHGAADEAEDAGGSEAVDEPQALPQVQPERSVDSSTSRALLDDADQDVTPWDPADVEPVVDQVDSVAPDENRPPTIDESASEAATASVPNPELSRRERWERYMDSNTNKSYYFNPTRRVSQWNRPTMNDEMDDVVDKTVEDELNAGEPDSVEGGEARINELDTWVQAKEAGTLLESNGGWDRYLMKESGEFFFHHPERNEFVLASACSGGAPDEFSAAKNRLLSTCMEIENQSARWSLRRNRSLRGDKRGEWQAFIDAETHQTFYYNSTTHESTWDKPAVFLQPQNASHSNYEWVMYIDAASSAPYYVNLATNVTTWEKPVDFTDAMGDQDLNRMQSIAEPSVGMTARDEQEEYVISVNEEGAVFDWDEPSSRRRSPSAINHTR